MILAFTALLLAALLAFLSVLLFTRVNDLTQQVERLRRALYPVSIRGNWRKDEGRAGRYVWTSKNFDALKLSQKAHEVLEGWTPPELKGGK